MMLIRIVTFAFALRSLWASRLNDDDTVVQIYTDKYDKYFVESNGLEVSTFSRRDWALIQTSVVSNVATMILLGVSFWAIHDCGLNTDLQDCYKKDLAIEYGLAAMAIWILGSVLELALSENRIPALLRLPFAGLAYMVGYAEKVDRGMMYTGSLAILSIFSIYFTMVNVLYGKANTYSKKYD